MTVAEYIRDYKMNFIFHILFLMILTAILTTMRLDPFAVIYIVLIGVLLAMTAAVYDFLSKRTFYQNM